jgi:hypothetical protein
VARRPQLVHDPLPDEPGSADDEDGQADSSSLAKLSDACGVSPLLACGES